MLTFNYHIMNLKCKMFNIFLKRYKILFSFIIFLTFNFGCQKYVDIKKNSAQGVIETVDDVQLLLDTYGVMNTGYPSDIQLSSDDFYISAQTYLATNVTSEDRIVYSWQPIGRSLASPQWQGPYTVVYRSNLALETVDNLKSSKNSSNIEILNSLRGSALFFRAYAFWNLAQIYCNPYNSSTADMDLGIPLRLKSDINDKSNRGSVAQTYIRIIQDLTESISLLPNSSIVASRPNKAAVYAMLARVYLSMDDYTNALNSANSALLINNNLIDYNSISLTSSNPFTRFNKEVIFHSVIGSSQLTSPGSQNAPIAIINNDLALSYASNDLRGKIFLKQNFSRRINSITGDYVKDSKGVVQYFPDNSYRFSGNYEPSSSSTQFNGLTVDELYLVRAECYARQNKVSEAMSDLNFLLKTRWVTGTYINLVANSADEALRVILIERRKELLMRSQRWTDLRRLNKDIRFKQELKRVISFLPAPNVTTSPDITFDLPANDLRYTLQLPQEVITNAALPQNPK